MLFSAPADDGAGLQNDGDRDNTERDYGNLWERESMTDFLEIIKVSRVW
jgi:hypothetical protein